MWILPFLPLGTREWTVDEWFQCCVWVTANLIYFSELYCGVRVMFTAEQMENCMLSTRTTIRALLFFVYELFWLCAFSKEFWGVPDDEPFGLCTDDRGDQPTISVCVPEGFWLTMAIGIASMGLVSHFGFAPWNDHPPLPPGWPATLH